MKVEVDPRTVGGDLGETTHIVIHFNNGQTIRMNAFDGIDGAGIGVYYRDAQRARTVTESHLVRLGDR